MIQLTFYRNHSMNPFQADRNKLTRLREMFHLERVTHLRTDVPPSVYRSTDGDDCESVISQGVTTHAVTVKILERNCVYQ